MWQWIMIPGWRADMACWSARPDDRVSWWLFRSVFRASGLVCAMSERRPLAVVLCPLRLQRIPVRAYDAARVEGAGRYSCSVVSFVLAQPL